jgi:uncharacterized protein YhfF
MQIPSHVAAFWDRFRAHAGAVDPARLYEVFCFGGSEQLADSLAALVLAGTKRATASSVWSLESEGKPAPRPGDLSVVTNWAGTPLCVIETTRVDTVAFAQVSEEFAAVEGEGDGSLSHWREGHTQYFARECSRIGRVFVATMPVLCERFEVVYQEAPGIAA